MDSLRAALNDSGVTLHCGQNMASVFSHPIPAAAIIVAFGPRVIPPRLAAAGLLCSVLPDLDVVGFKFGVAYAEMLGHRGFSHSLLFALGLAALGCLFAPLLKSRPAIAFFFLLAVTLSHILLDALTTGGLGVAFFWPWEETRWFLPWRPIRVSPFSLEAFLSRRGPDILLSELRWVWAPSAAFAVAGLTLRRIIAR